MLRSIAEALTTWELFKRYLKRTVLMPSTSKKPNAQWRKNSEMARSKFSACSFMRTSVRETRSANYAWPWNLHLHVCVWFSIICAMNWKFSYVDCDYMPQRSSCAGNLAKPKSLRFNWLSRTALVWWVESHHFWHFLGTSVKLWSFAIQLQNEHMLNFALWMCRQHKPHHVRPPQDCLRWRL